jgi:hypothetical protein
MAAAADWKGVTVSSIKEARGLAAGPPISQQLAARRAIVGVIRIRLPQCRTGIPVVGCPQDAAATGSHGTASTFE